MLLFSASWFWYQGTQVRDEIEVLTLPATGSLPLLANTVLEWSKMKRALPIVLFSCTVLYSSRTGHHRTSEKGRVAF